MDLLIIRLGKNYDEESFEKSAKAYQESINGYTVIVLLGENENIETSFQVIELPNNK